MTTQSKKLVFIADISVSLPNHEVVLTEGCEYSSEEWMDKLYQLTEAWGDAKPYICFRTRTISND